MSTQSTSNGTTAKTNRAKSNETASSNPFEGAFDLSKFTIPGFDGNQLVKDFAEKVTEQAQTTYLTAKKAVEETGLLSEEYVDNSRKGVVELNVKSLEAIKANTDASFALVKDLLGAKTVSHALEIQNSFWRDQMTAGASQIKEFQNSATDLGESLTAPFANAVKKGWNTGKTA